MAHRKVGRLHLYIALQEATGTASAVRSRVLLEQPVYILIFSLFAVLGLKTTRRLVSHE